MSGKTQQQRQFIELRANGNSFASIAAQLGVAKSTLINWSREYELEISNLKSLVHDELLEKYRLMRQNQLEILGEQLHNVRQELTKRDLSKVSTDKLVAIELKLLEAINADRAIVFQRDGGLMGQVFDGVRIQWEA